VNLWSKLQQNIFTSEGLNAGVRAFPDFSRSRLRVRSADRRDLLTGKMLQNARKISIRDVEQLREVVFDFNIVMHPRKAEPRRRFQSIAGRLIQLPIKPLRLTAIGASPLT